MGHGTDQREFSSSSMTEAFQRKAVSLLDECQRHCVLIHGERRDRRDLINREAFFIMGSSAVPVGELPYLRGEDLKSDAKTPPSSRNRRPSVRL